MSTELTYNEWLAVMKMIFESLSTNGQKIYVDSPFMQNWAGLHVEAGSTVEVDRTFTFRFRN